MEHKTAIAATIVIPTLLLGAIVVGPGHAHVEHVRASGSSKAAPTSTASPKAADAAGPAPSSPPVNCDPSATSGRAPTSYGDTERLANFAPTRVPGANDHAMSEAAAVAAARGPQRKEYSSAAPDRSIAPASASELSYAQLIARASMVLSPEADIAGQRCVWLVTVHAPYSVSAPGGPIKTMTVYNVIYDLATGTHMATVAGVDLSK